MPPGDIERGNFVCFMKVFVSGKVERVGVVDEAESFVLCNL